MGIYIAAAIASAIALVSWGALVRNGSAPEQRRFLLVAGALTLPMFFVALWGVRLPFTDPLILRFARWVHPDLPLGSLRATAAYLLPKSLEAPLVEEPAKLWPLLIPAFAARVKGADPVRVGLALGLGFAVSEVWGLAVLLHAYPPYRELPFWMFSGFIGERVLVGLLHGVFASRALRRWDNGFAAGVLVAMAAHWACNFPIVLSALNLPPLGALWPAVLSAWVALCFVVGLVTVQGELAERRAGG